MTKLVTRGIEDNAITGAKRRLNNNEWERALNTSSADVNLHKYNASNEWEFNLLPKYSGSNIATENYVDTAVAGASSDIAIQSVSTNTSISGAAKLVKVDATSGNITITLPQASTVPGRIYRIKKMDSSANTVLIDGDGSELIDGVADFTIYDQYYCLSVVSDGTGWNII
jgi:hypothetical protein